MTPAPACSTPLTYPAPRTRLAGMRERDERIVKAYLASGSMSATAEEFGLSRERVRQIATKALGMGHRERVGAPGHGTTTKYRYGCRCRACRRAAAESRKSKPAA